MADVIKSYLVSLSAGVDKASFDKFASAMQGAEKTVAGSVGGIVGNFLKFQVAGTTAFASVGFGLIAYIDKLAQADLKTTLLAQQNMMSVQQYRAVSTALDTLGVTLDDVFFGTKEVQERFHTLIEDQKQLAAVLGPGYEKQQQMVRDVTFQLQRLEVKGEYFGMAFVSQLLEKLGFGKGGIVIELEHLNDYVLNNLPKWADVFSTDVIPYLSQLWDLLKVLGNDAIGLEHNFIHMIGAISGNTDLENSTGSFKDFAESIGIAAHEFGVLLQLMAKVETIIPPLIDMMLHMVVGAAELSSGHPIKAKSEFDQAHDIGEGSLADAAKGVKDFMASNPWAYNQPEQIADLKRAVSGYSMPLGSGMPTDPNFMRLVYGIALTESGDRQTDASGKTIMGPPNPSGELAVGRMQLLPSTAKMLGVDPYDAGQNLLGGEKYLAQLLYRHGGNVGDALADYGGASGGQYSAKGQDYIRKVESAGGISIGTIIVNSSPSLTPEQHAAAIKKGVREGFDQHVQQQMAELNGAYQ
jgi:hypothetical protein